MSNCSRRARGTSRVDAQMEKRAVTANMSELQPVQSACMEVISNEDGPVLVSRETPACRDSPLSIPPDSPVFLFVPRLLAPVMPLMARRRAIQVQMGNLGGGQSVSAALNREHSRP